MDGNQKQDPSWKDKWAFKNVNLPADLADRIEVCRVKDQRSFSNMLSIIAALGVDEWWRRRGEVEPLPTTGVVDSAEPAPQVE